MTNLNITREQKLAIRPFLNALNVGRGTASRFAMAYYQGEIPGLLGAIDFYTLTAPEYRRKLVLLMLEKMPVADLPTIIWMNKNYLFDGTVWETTAAFHLWAMKGGKYWCPNCRSFAELGSSLEPNRGTVYHDHSQDLVFWWETTCGHPACQYHYHDEEMPREIYIP